MKLHRWNGNKFLPTYHAEKETVKKKKGQWIPFVTSYLNVISANVWTIQRYISFYSEIYQPVGKRKKKEKKDFLKMCVPIFFLSN